MFEKSTIILYLFDITNIILKGFTNLKKYLNFIFELNFILNIVLKSSSNQKLSFSILNKQNDNEIF